MGYTPTTWSTGDTITAQAMNKIENGIAGAGGALICTASWNSSLSATALDKTVQEIYDALLSGTPVYIKYQYGILGASGTGSYESRLYLAPVIKIYGYNYTEVIRICASKPNAIGNKGTTYTAFSPAVLLFSASSMSGYPTFYDTIYTPTNYVSNSGGLD